MSVIYRKYIFYNYYLEKNLEINDAYTAKPKSYRIYHQTDDSFYVKSNHLKKNPAYLPILLCKASVHALQNEEYSGIFLRLYDFTFTLKLHAYAYRVDIVVYV